MNTSTLTAAVEHAAGDSRQRRENVLIAAGLAVVAVLALALYWRTLSIGFLLDDLWHLEYLYRAFHGDPHALTQHLIGGWSQVTDGLRCYRPGTTVSLMLDYLVGNGNAQWFHMTNLVLLVVTSTLTGLLGFQLCSIWGLRHKTLASVGAALLFVCYPLHAESVAWIVGRVDLLCTLFYVASLSAFLRYRQTERQGWLIAALSTFLISLTCKEMAVTLPVVLGVLVSVLPRRTSNHARTLWLAVAAFCVVLFGFAIWRTVALGTLIGGYGSTGKRALAQGLRNFIDGATWFKVIVPATDEYPTPTWLSISCVTGFAASALLGLFATAHSGSGRRPNQPALWRLSVFLIAWLAIALLPTFQIFHIFPNLVGSRLFFLSSVPLCMLAAMGPAAFAEQSAGGPLALRSGRPLACCGIAAVLLTAVAASWCVCLGINLQPWSEAGIRMKTLAEQACTLAKATPPGKHVLLANLPADYKGAGMVGRPEYLAVLCRPPLSSTDLSDRLATCELPEGQPHEYVSPEELRRQMTQCTASYAWNDTAARFERLQLPDGDADARGTVDSASLSQYAEFRREGDVYWLPINNINPLSAQSLTVDLSSNAATAGPVQLVWRSPRQPWWLCRAQPDEVNGNRVIFRPARLRAWTFSGAITQLGIQTRADIKRASLHWSPATVCDVRKSAHP